MILQQRVFFIFWIHPNQSQALQYNLLLLSFFCLKQLIEVVYLFTILTAPLVKFYCDLFNMILINPDNIDTTLDKKKTVTYCSF